jgi:type III secretory pathway component EscR
MHDLYKSIVVINKLCSHEFFLDEMNMYDLYLMTKYLSYADMAAWQQTRQIMLSSLRPYLKKKNITAQEFFPLIIDEKEEDDREKTTSVSNEQLEMLKQAQEYYKKQKDSN